ncbi:MAG TPA: hypothetical protein VJ927_07175 [Actinomycetota bacterium]|nr:hypothetical protein [Actinomycetota bacterium]
MLTTSTARAMSFSEAMRNVDAGAAFVDLRDVASYLDVHIPGSLSLLYESGPGFPSRARDLIPLDLPLVLMTREDADMDNAAAALRGRGFSVLGQVPDAVNEWSRWLGAPASTETYQGPRPRRGRLLDVGDPGAAAVNEADAIPIPQLWARAGELDDGSGITVIAGYGVRAALAVGILERAGLDGIVFWQSRDPRSRA